MQEPIDQPEGQRKAALTINIQSWATPLVGVIALIVGLFGGYLLRPLVSGTAQTSSNQTVPPTQVAQVPNPVQTVSGSTDSNSPGGTSTPSLMEYLMSQARHIKGNPEATVTIIEFSDYQ